MSMNNPYAPPSKDATAGPDPSASVRPPATALIIVTIVWLVLISLSMLFSGYLLTSGSAASGRTYSDESTIVVRLILGVCVLVVNAVILAGAIEMRALQNYPLARAAAIMAVIPCLTPCYLLGIPFGIWALMTLIKPEVRDAFK
jgi:hypothetical protein